MQSIVDRWELPNGAVAEAAYDDYAEQPSGIGTILTWARGYSSPDENPYESPNDFVADKLAELFSARELAEAVDGRDHLKALRLTRSGGSVAVELRGAAGWFEEMVVDSDDFDRMAADDDAWLREELANLATLSPGALALLNRKLVVEKVYMLVHSGVSYSTGDFGDPWDSGFAGFAFADAKDCGMDEGSVRSALAAEVPTYGQWANGEVYAVTVTMPDGASSTVGGIYSDDFEEIADELARELAAA